MAGSLSAPCDLPEVSRAAEKSIPGQKYECKSFISFIIRI